jgi:hypothetical protein
MMSGNESIDRQERKTRRWLRLALVAIPSVALLIVLTVLQPWNTVPSPQSNVAKAYAATSDVKSYRFSGTSDSEDLDGFSTQQNIEAEFTSPDSYHVKMIENGQEIEFIIIGDKQYLNSDSLNKHLSLVMTQGLYRMSSREGAMSYLDMLTDIRELPEVKIDGVSCLHYYGRQDIEKQITETKRTIMESQLQVGIEPDEEEIDKHLEIMRFVDVKIELWIGRYDYIIRQLKVNGRFPDDDEGRKFVTTNVTMQFFNLNQPVTIKAPLDTNGQLLPGWWIADTQ